MNTRIVYFDETGDDGCNISSSSSFILTSLSIPTELWQDNFNATKKFRKQLKEDFGFHSNVEMHTKHFLTDKNPYRSYGWTNEQKIEILKRFTLHISQMDISVINVIIDKTKLQNANYPILRNALTYNIQRIENDCNGVWNYLIITDKGRLGAMGKTARAIRAYNPIQSQFGGFINKPIKHLIEDIIEKDSKESYFIQICDFISFFVHLYYKTHFKHEKLPNRIASLIDPSFVGSVMATFCANGILNTKASSKKYGLIIYPK